MHSPMKEGPPTGHPCVAAHTERTTRCSRRQQVATATTTTTATTNNNTDLLNKNNPEHDDSDSEGDWDVGVGNLVIDLDADLERHQRTAVVATEGVPSSVTSGKMSSVEHHAVVDKGLKMKIKRKNVGSKSSDIKHEIVKAAEGKVSGVGGSNREGVENTSGNNLSGSVPNSPMDKQKHGSNIDSKEKSTKGRGTHKKEKGRAKGAEPVANGSPFHGASGSTSGNSSSSGSAATNTAIPTHKITVDLYPIPTPFNIKKETPADDPYEFNAKVEDGGRPIGFPVKKIKVEKVGIALVLHASVLFFLPRTLLSTRSYSINCMVLL